MKVFKSKFIDRKTRQMRQTTKWYLWFKDHQDTVRRMPAFSNKAASEELGRKIDQLVTHRILGSLNDTVLIRWAESLSPDLRARLTQFGLLDGRLSSAGMPLSDHVRDFVASLSASENTTAYVNLVESRIRRIINGCGFIHLSDLSASRTQSFLAGLRKPAEGKGISAQTHNFYLTAIKAFCRWMVRDQRAADSPLLHLQGLNVRTDRRHDRRALAIEEVIHLLDTTAAGPERGRVSGDERALLYQFAVMTALRANEIRTLRVSDFRLDAKPPVVRVAAGYSKHRREDRVVLRTGLVEQLRTHLATKLPNATAFRMPGRTYLARVVKADLDAAREAWLATAPDAKARAEMGASDFLAYQDTNGQFADFHSFRHMTGSFLAKAGVSPKMAQSILRHSDYKLTMNLYSHAYQSDQVAAVERLPDLSPATRNGAGAQKTSA